MRDVGRSDAEAAPWGPPYHRGGGWRRDFVEIYMPKGARERSKLYAACD